MGCRLGSERGSVSVQALLLLGLFMLLLGLVAEIGAVRAKSMRLQAAFDRAALAAAGAIDPQVLATSGNIVLAEADAELIARRYLVANVEPMEGLLADQTAAQVAAGAQIETSGGSDPSVTVTGEISLPSGLLALAGVGDSVTFRIQSSSQLKGN